MKIWKIYEKRELTCRLNVYKYWADPVQACNDLCRRGRSLNQQKMDEFPVTELGEKRIRIWRIKNDNESLPRFWEILWSSDQVYHESFAE